jgi:hypothetical protein
MQLSINFQLNAEEVTEHLAGRGSLYSQFRTGSVVNADLMSELKLSILRKSLPWRFMIIYV